MNTELICQSCGMPMGRLETRGTEKDGSKSIEYCKYCYQHGEFTQDHRTIDEMKAKIISKMKQQNIAPTQIDHTLNKLMSLRRWRVMDKNI